MTTLKDKEVKLKLTYNNGKINLCHSKDVKEAVLKFEKYLNDVDYDDDYINLVKEKYKQIFGDWEK